jgi:hypothetical protein
MAVPNISFHDSWLEDVRAHGKALMLFIRIDTHWFPGRQYGILRLVGVVNPARAVAAYRKVPVPVIRQLDIKRRGKAYRVSISLIEGSAIPVSCRSVSFKRVDRYRKKRGGPANAPVHGLPQTRRKNIWVGVLKAAAVVGAFLLVWALLSGFK